MAEETDVNLGEKLVNLDVLKAALPDNELEGKTIGIIPMEDIPNYKEIVGDSIVLGAFVRYGSLNVEYFLQPTYSTNQLKFNRTTMTVSSYTTQIVVTHISIDNLTTTPINLNLHAFTFKATPSALSNSGYTSSVNTYEPHDLKIIYVKE